MLCYRVNCLKMEKEKHRNKTLDKLKVKYYILSATYFFLFCFMIRENRTEKILKLFFIFFYLRVRDIIDAIKILKK